MRLIDADALYRKMPMKVCLPCPFGEEKECEDCVIDEVMKVIDEAPTIHAPRWHRVEDELPDSKTDAIFFYEWTGISGTVYKEISIISLEELMALGCRPIAWMEKPEPPKEGV